MTEEKLIAALREIEPTPTKEPNWQAMETAVVANVQTKPRRGWLAWLLVPTIAAAAAGMYFALQPASRVDQPTAMEAPTATEDEVAAVADEAWAVFDDELGESYLGWDDDWDDDGADFDLDEEI